MNTIRKHPKVDTILGSSNISTLLKYLEWDCVWISKINSELDK